jgi:hypothetical protein
MCCGHGEANQRVKRISFVEQERRTSQRIQFETPITFEVEKRRFFGTTANLSDDGMMIESSFARDKVRRVIRRLMRGDNCPVQVTYTARGKSLTRQGMIKHYRVDYSDGQSVYRLSFGVWIPKLRMRQEKGL